MSMDVAGRCPACKSRSLFLGDGGWVTCSWAECPDPTAVADLLDGDQGDYERWPLPRHRGRWKSEVRDKWVDVLASFPLGATVLANDSAYWVKVRSPGVDAMWRSGGNTVSTMVLLMLHDDFVLVGEPGRAQ